MDPSKITTPKKVKVKQDITGTSETKIYEESPGFVLDDSINDLLLLKKRKQDEHEQQDHAKHALVNTNNNNKNIVFRKEQIVNVLL